MPAPIVFTFSFASAPQEVTTKVSRELSKLHQAVTCTEPSGIQSFYIHKGEYANITKGVCVLYNRDQAPLVMNTLRDISNKEGVLLELFFYDQCKEVIYYKKEEPNDSVPTSQIS